MRKVIVAVVILAALAGGYFWISKNARVSLSALEGETAKVHRGDLVIPITASGNIKPATVTQIKSKASGEVIKIPFEIGTMVKRDDLVVQLLDVDERNSRDRAKADRDRARIELEKARIAKRQAEKVGVPAAEAKLMQYQAQLAETEWEFNKQKELRALKNKEGGFDPASALEFNVKKAQYEQAQGLVAASKADVEQANIAVEQAQKNIDSADEMLNTAQKALDDAEQRLKETKVFSPINGMVLSRNVQIGEVVQSGKTMFTGGTVLMEIADVSQLYAVVNVDEADIGRVSGLAPNWARPGRTTQPAAMNIQTQSPILDTQPAALAAQPAASLPADTFEGSEPVEVTVESFKDEKFSGMIERISPQSEFSGGVATFKVWIHITSPNREKLVGLLNTQAEAHFTAKSVRDAILVSYDAIQKDPNSDAYGVYVPTQAPGKVRPEPKFKACKFGVDNGIDVEVVTGLKEGEQVYTKLPQKTDREKEADEKKS